MEALWYMLDGVLLLVAVVAVFICIVLLAVGFGKILGKIRNVAIAVLSRRNVAKPEIENMVFDFQFTFICLVVTLLPPVAMLALNNFGVKAATSSIEAVAYSWLSFCGAITIVAIVFSVRRYLIIRKRILSSRTQQPISEPLDS